MAVRPDHSKIAEMAKLLVDAQNGKSRNWTAILADVVQSAARAVPGAQYAGLTLVDDKTGIHNVAATHPHAVTLDDVQRRVLDGPSLAAAKENCTVRVDDLTTDERWPAYRAGALELTPIRSIMSFEVSAGEHARGALNFFAERPGAFGDDAVELGLIFANHTAIAWGMSRRDEQFRSALSSRDEIGQAKGILMERFGVDAVRAFELLKRLSQDTNTPLHQIAQRVTTTRESKVDG